MSNLQSINLDDNNNNNNPQLQQNDSNLDSQFALQTLTSSLSNLSTSSHTLPSDKDFHFYNNFDSFKNPVRQISIQTHSLLQAIGNSSNQIFDNKFDFSNLVDNVDETCDLLVDVNDDIFDMFDSSIDEFKTTRNGHYVPQNASDDDGGSGEGDGFQVVSGKKKKKVVKVVEKKKVPFHVASIRRPQDVYNILVNNSNMPFEHVWLQRTDDGLRPIHPLEKVSVLDFVEDTTQSIEPVPPPTLESTPFKFVEEVKDLKELMNKLRQVKEFAVDLEHNQYRSFQGLTCLMQISTRTEDYVVDTLKLRVHVGPYLREAFKDPTKKKVLHGADRDIIWLQKDFGIYVCNMFDTGQASRVLKLERNSLEYLLRHYCDVTANKEYQNADWRIRPIPDEMLRYAREDTHYLLYIYDLMKKELISMPNDADKSDSPLVEVYKRSYDICMQLYEKELLTETSYLHLYGLPNAGFNAQQLAIVSGLFEWRDVIARTEDESTGYILPNKTLLEIAKHKPVTSSQLKRVLKSKHPYVERNLESVVNIIRHSMRNSNAFESALQYLKERQKELAMRAANTEAADGCEVSASDSPTKLQNDSDAMDSSGHVTSPVTKNEKGVFSKHKSQNGNISFAPSNQVGARESLSVSLQSRGALSSSPKAPGAVVQVQKKPNKGFGALLGKPSAKIRPDLDKKDVEVSKLEKIRSSVNLPFHSFLGRTEPTKPVGEPAKVPEIQRPEEPIATTAATHIQMPDVTATVTDSSLKEVIYLDDDNELDSDDSEPTTNTRNGETSVLDIHPTEEPKQAALSGFEDVILLDEDDDDDDDLKEIENYGKSEDESVSLSDLSTSFEKCFQSTKQNKKPNSKTPQGSSGLGQFKAFNYAAAIGMVKFGKDEGEAAEGKDEKNGKKNSGRDGGKKDNGTREFLPARRRQAFPASGNRSGTFR